MTPMTMVRWAVLLFPLALLPIAVLGAGRYPLVLREETISPIVGAPKLLVYISPIITLAYLGLIILVSRQQASDFIHKGSYQSRGLWLMLPLTLLFTTWGAGQTLNGMLDFSQPQYFQTVVIGSTHISSTPYIKVQDWNHRGKFVYVDRGQEFLEKHPIGSTLFVSTKRGIFGYEWYCQ